MDEQIQIFLNKDEAIVLFDFLSRFSDRGDLVIADQSEARVLWNLCSDLEKILVEPLKANFREILTQARENVRDNIEQ
jgi:hypothetical protein